jgi:hypothetical protein
MSMKMSHGMAWMHSQRQQSHAGEDASICVRPIFISNAHAPRQKLIRDGWKTEPIGVKIQFSMGNKSAELIWFFILPA